MSWNAILEQAARRFDGGGRSFPPARDASCRVYEPPNEDYEMLLSSRTKPLPKPSYPPTPLSCGWIIPDDTHVCKPVFVAHSLLSAIWLVRDSLPEDTLPDDSWACLVSAAHIISVPPSDGLPPTVQKPQQRHEDLPDRELHEAAIESSERSALGPKRVEISELTPPSSKRTRVEDEATPGASCAPRVQTRGKPSKDSNSNLASSASIIVNHNHRTKRVRPRNTQSLPSKKRLGLGLIAPAENAPLVEKTAFANLPPQDEMTVAWIIKQQVTKSGQDFYSCSRSPYYTAQVLLERARSLSGTAARYQAAQFLHSWRERGSPFRHAEDLKSSQKLRARGYKQLRVGAKMTSRSSSNLTDKAFCFAWDLCTRAEGELTAVHIEYRWAAALLGQAFVQKTMQIRENDRAISIDARNRYGRGQVKGEAFEILLKMVCPEPTETDKLIFRKRLAKASRWFTVAQSLGWGSLTLMPHDKIPNSWIESALRVGELDVWMELVKKVNPDVYSASKALDSWLGPDGINGGSIRAKKPLSIEAEASTTIYEIEEVQDSEDESNEGDEHDVELTLVESQTPASERTATPARNLRQMSLLDLFHPIE